jgi:hypothetical protein
MIKALFATKEEIPAGMEDNYAEVPDVGFVLQVEEASGFALENITGLRNALGEANKQNGTLGSLLKPYGAYDKVSGKFAASITPDSMATATAELADLRQQLEAAGPGDSKKKISDLQEGFRAKLAEVQAAHESQLTDTQAEHKAAHDTLLGQYTTVARDQAIDAAILTHKGKANYLQPHIASKARLDDEMSLVLFDGDRPRMGSDGKPQTVDAYVAELKKDVSNWGDAFHAEPAAGTGSPGTQRQPVMPSAGSQEPSQGAYFVDQ